MPDLRLRTIASPLGPLLAGVVEPGNSPLEPGGVCLLEFDDDDRRARERHELESHFGSVFLADSVGAPSPTLDRLEAELNDYFNGRLRAFTLPLCTPGTAFQHRVWTAMLAVRFGQTMTYKGLAERIGSGVSAARAVGAASGRNRVAILVPCHRIVDTSYDLSVGGGVGLRGYGGGLDTKQWLLEHEARAARPGLWPEPLSSGAKGG